MIFFRILIVFVATILISCGEKKQTNEDAEVELAKFLAAQYVKETGEFDISKTYPFSDARRIEILSYPDRFVWDTLPTSSHSPIQNGQIAIEQSRVKERVELSLTQKADLFNLLYNTKCNLPSSAACYDPRHAVIFFDKDDKAFAYIEICLSCLTTKESKDVNIGELCSEKITDIRNMFKNFGIKYGLDGEDY